MHTRHRFLLSMTAFEWFRRVRRLFSNFSFFLSRFGRAFSNVVYPICRHINHWHFNSLHLLNLRIETIAFFCCCSIASFTFVAFDSIRRARRFFVGFISLPFERWSHQKKKSRKKRNNPLVGQMQSNCKATNSKSFLFRVTNTQNRTPSVCRSCFFFFSSSCRHYFPLIVCSSCFRLDQRWCPSPNDEPQKKRTIEAIFCFLNSTMRKSVNMTFSFIVFNLHCVCACASLPKKFLHIVFGQSFYGFLSENEIAFLGVRRVERQEMRFSKRNET